VLEALGNLGDFIGGIAVVVTLVYLATQIRQNTSALRTASRQAVSSGYRETNRLRLAPDAARAWAMGLRGFGSLPFAESAMFSTLIADESLFFQEAYALHESGQLDESTYRAYLDWFSAIIATPGGTHWWETAGRPIYTPGMIDAVDARLAAGEVLDILEIPGFRLDEEGAA